MIFTVTAVVLLLSRVSAVSTEIPHSSLPAFQSQVINSLVSPNSSQKFFEAGNQQLEQEIKQLLQMQETPSENILQIDKDLLEQKSLRELESISTETKDQK